MDGLDDFGVVDSAQASRCDREIGLPELSLDHDQRDPLAGHLDRVRMPELVRREPAADTGRHGGVMELTADPGGRARASACWTAQDAEQRAGRQCCAQLEPRLEVLLIPTRWLFRLGGRASGVCTVAALSCWHNRGGLSLGRACGSEVLEEREQLVGWLVAAGLGAGWGGAIDRSLFEGEIGVQVDLRGLVTFVAELERDRGGVDRGLQ